MVPEDPIEEFRRKREEEKRKPVEGKTGELGRVSDYFRPVPPSRAAPAAPPPAPPAEEKHANPSASGPVSRASWQALIRTLVERGVLTQDDARRLES